MAESMIKARFGVWMAYPHFAGLPVFICRQGAYNGHADETPVSDLRIHVGIRSDHSIESRCADDDS